MVESLIRPTRRRFLAGASTALAAPFVLSGTTLFSGAASAAEDPKLIAAAKAEGKGMVYSVQDPAISKLFFDAFTKKYGIPIEVMRLNSGPLGQRFAQEAETGNVVADVLALGDDVFINTAIQKGWFAKIESLPSLGDLPKELWNGYAAPMSYNPATLIYNTSIVTKAPAGWEALADPQYAGRVMLTDPRNSLPVAEWFMLMRQTYGDEFIKKIGSQARFTESTVTSGQQVAAGAMAMANSLHQIVVPLKQKGAPVDEVFPEPTAVQRTLAGVSAKAPHPNVGRLVLDFYISMEGQKILNEDNWSPLGEIPGSRKMPKFVRYEPDKVKASVPELAKLLGLA